jgi:hypothetical protein
MPMIDRLQVTRETWAWKQANGFAHCPIIALIAKGVGEVCRLARPDGFGLSHLSQIDLLAAINGFLLERTPAGDWRRQGL